MRPALKLRADALAELRWYFAEAEGAAAGLRAVTWNILEEVEPSRRGGTSGPGVKRGAPPMVDPHPDERAWARVRLRRVHAAFSLCSHPTQAVLEAHLLPRGADVPRIHELGPEHSYVAALLPEVQRLAAASRRPRLVEAQLLVAKVGAAAVLASCVASVTRALDEYVTGRFPQLQIPRSP